MNKTGFKDPMEPKNPKKIIKNPWSFKQPGFNESTSRYVNAGTNYGTGINQPIGHKGNPKDQVDILPRGRVKTMSIYPDAEKTEIQ